MTTTIGSANSLIQNGTDGLSLANPPLLSYTGIINQTMVEAMEQENADMTVCGFPMFFNWPGVGKLDNQTLKAGGVMRFKPSRVALRAVPPNEVEEICTATHKARTPVKSFKPCTGILHFC